MLDRPETLLVLLAGAALLLAGRRLFWLFVGVVGFCAGLRLSLQILGPDVQGMRWIVAIAVGFVGVVLALVLQRAAVALAGFFVGGYAAVVLFHLNFVHPRPLSFLFFGIAGVLAAMLALRLFEGALIVLSSFAGAGLIVEWLRPRPGLGGAVLLVLTVVGIAVQAGITSRGAYRGASPERAPRAAGPR